MKLLFLFVLLISCNNYKNKSEAKKFFVRDIDTNKINYSLLYGGKKIFINISEAFFDSLVRDNKHFWKEYPKDAEYTDEYTDEGDTLHLKFWRKEDIAYRGDTVLLTSQYFFTKNYLKEIRLAFVWADSFLKHNRMNERIKAFLDSTSLSFINKASHIGDSIYILKRSLDEIDFKRTGIQEFEIILK